MTVHQNGDKSKRLDYAQWFARIGITVFIVEPGGKRPLGGNSWYLRQTVDPDQVAEWFETTKNANYGLHMGPEYVAIDLDLKPGIDGVAEFQKICTENGIDDFLTGLNTLTIATPGGGYHLIFRVPFPCANANRFPKGIDVRGAIGYIVGAGSQDSRGTWEIVNKAKIAPCPDWLLPFLKEPGTKDPSAHIPLVELDLPENIEQARLWLQEAKPAVEGENGDDHTYEICCKLRDFGLSEGGALDVLIQSGWNDRCDPPWENDELEKKIENSYEYGQNRPGCAAESLQLARIIACRPDDDYGLTPEKIHEMFHPLPPRLIVDNTSPPVDSEVPSDVAESDADEGYYFPAYMESELDSIPDPDFLIDQNVGEASTHMVFGPSGALKTFYVLDQALHGVTNRVWAAKTEHSFPGFKIKRPLRVAMIVGEGARGMKRRIRAWKLRHNVNKDLMFLVLPIMPVFKFPTEREKLVRTIKHHLGTCDLVIIDTAMRASSGLNLMDPTGARDFLDTLDDVSGRLDGAAMTFVHHTGKDIGKGALGADYLKAHVDYVDFIECVHEAPGERIIKVQNHKAKDGEKRADMWFKATQQDIPVKGASVPVRSLVLERHGKVPPKSFASGAVSKADQRVNEVRAALVDLGADGKQILNAVLANKIIHMQIDNDPDLATKTEPHDRERMERSERTLLRRQGRSGLLGEFVAGSVDVSDIAWHLPGSKPATVARD